MMPSFPGKVGETLADSEPFWPERRRSAGPNVVVVLLDDVGFAQLGCYGSSIRTPRMDALAARGLRYTNFHVTALCSPTRASLLTGRNHHSVGVGFLAAFDTGYPGYRGAMSAEAATVAEMLRSNGYGTYACGKWHLVAPNQMTPAGPFDDWPTQRGFDRYYGFLWGEDDQWTPELWYDQHRVKVPTTPGYHLSEDLVTKSVEFLSDHVTARPEDPFFLYLAPGACHAPHQAPSVYIDRYRGAFDGGWDQERRKVLTRQIELGIVPPGTVLAPRNPDVPAWEDLPADHRHLYARMQEVFAGFMEHTDDQIGVLVDYLHSYDLLDDTVIMIMSDNGASGEGGEHGTTNEYRYFLGLDDSVEDALKAYDELGGRNTHNHYPSGWAQAGNTPLKFYKKFTFGGGVRAPLIVHWPSGIDAKSALRTQFHNVTDILPTITGLAAVSIPDAYRGVPQLPVHGTSMEYSFLDDARPSTRATQYFETAGYRGIYSKGWKAVTLHEPGQPFELDEWQLYRLETDFSECQNLAAERPDLVGQLKHLWWSEARRNGVLPLDDRMGARMKAMNPSDDKLLYKMLPGSRLMNQVVGPNFSGRAFRVKAMVTRGGSDHDGVLLAYGRRASGLSLFVLRGKLVFDFNLAGKHTVLRSPAEMPLGALVLQVRVFQHGDAVRAELLVDDNVVAAGELPQLMPAGMGTMSFQCGHNDPSAISPEYEAPFTFRGKLHHVLIELEPRTSESLTDDVQAELAQQ